MFATVDSSIATGAAAKNRLYHNLGGGAFTKVTEGPFVKDSGYAAGCAWADYDNNGSPDVFVTYGSIYAAQKNALYQNTASSNSWLKLKCVGFASNRSAIGAKVQVKARIGGVERWQTRQILGTEGWLSFNCLDVLVGLGDAAQADLVRVEWPSGIVQEFANVSARRTFTVVEKTSLALLR